VTLRGRPLPAAVAILFTMLVLGCEAPAAWAGRSHIRGARAVRSVPTGFVGMNADGPLLLTADHVDLARQLDMMVRAGVETIRVAFSWSDAQPYATEADVPPAQASEFAEIGGVPTNFSATDELVGMAARRGLRVLPVVVYAPAWDARRNPSGYATPKRPAPYASYLTALVQRYGPRGTFWARGGPRLPIRMWQIWNEPNLASYWPQPSVAEYLGLLRAAHAALKHADRGATVVIGAMTNWSWRYLAEIYRHHGAGLFDVAAVNEFSASPGRLIQILQLVRQTLNEFGDTRMPLLATELSWTSARTSCECIVSDWDTTKAGQARDVAAALPLLAANRASLRLAGLYYYTWMGDESQLTYDFNFAGLLGFSSGAVDVKPALAAFMHAALVLEGCATKGPTITSCRR
jgi:hypothetical protein